MGIFLSTPVPVPVDPDAGLIETLPPALDWLSCPIDFDHRDEQFIMWTQSMWAMILDIPPGHEVWDDDNQRTMFKVPRCPFCAEELISQPIRLRFALQEALEQAGRISGDEIWRKFDDDRWLVVSGWWVGRSF